MKLKFSSNLCTGCHTCEVICTYHHKGMFGKSASSIRVIDDEKGANFRLIKNKHGGFVCDFCDGHPLCSKYCFTKAIAIVI
jgi:Fe-S-cluster-containing dehydrogenase component